MSFLYRTSVLHTLCVSVAGNIHVYAITQIISVQKKEAFRDITHQNQKKGEQRVYRQFCCIIRKAGATFRAATARGLLSSVFSPHPGYSNIKVAETNMISLS